MFRIKRDDLVEVRKGRERGKRTAGGFYRKAMRAAKPRNVNGPVG